MAIDTQVNYTFKIIDNITPTTEKMASSQDKLAKSTDEAKKRTDEQTKAFIAQVVAVGAVYHGLKLAVNSMHELGIVNDETAASLNKVLAGVGLVVAAFQTMKGAIQIVNMLRQAEIALTIATVFRQTFENPAKAAMLGVAAGAAAGAGAVLMMQNSQSTTVNQSFTFGNTGTPQGQDQALRSFYSGMGG